MSNDNTTRGGGFRRWLAGLLNWGIESAKAAPEHQPYGDETGPVFARGLGSWGKLDWPVKSKLPERLYWRLMEDVTANRSDTSSEIRNVLCQYYFEGKSYDEIMAEDALHEVKARAAARAGKGSAGSVSGTPNSAGVH